VTAVLISDRAGLEPYIDYPGGVPLDQWKELNSRRRWSAYFLWNQGVAQPALWLAARAPCRRCRAHRGAKWPATHRPLSSPSRCGHAHPRAHRVTNTRLTVHLPLIVPPDCGFRVGSETREWIPGKAWVFDGHDRARSLEPLGQPPRRRPAVLIFDI